MTPTSHAAAQATTAIPRSYRLVGWTRGALLIMMMLSSAWTTFLAILNYAPNETANYLMNTTRFDDGEFWQLAEIEETIMAGSVVGLGIVAAVYLYLAVLILRPPQAKPMKKGPAVRRETLTERLKTQIMKPLGPKAQTAVHDVGELRHQLMSQRGRYRKVWNLVLEIPEIIFQTVTLHSLLGNGIAKPIVSAYVAMMAVNCVYCFYHVAIAWKKHASHEMVGDAIMDVVFAIVFPAVTLLHTIRDFRGGLKWMLIREQFLPAKAYERRSRMYGDPRQISNFTLAYDCLRITDGLNLVVVVGFNLLTCLRWRRIVIMLQRARQLSQRRISQMPGRANASGTSIVPTEPTATKDGGLDADDPPKITSQPALDMVTIPVRVIPAPIGLLFVAFGVLTVLYTSMAVSASSAACSAVSNCTLHAYEWFPGAPDMACPCLVYIRGQLQSDSRDARDLDDATAELSMAAEAGRLRTIQLMNVAIQGKLPSNVKACSEIQDIVLLNSDLEALPIGWTWTFQKLKFLYITTAANSNGLTSIPSGFFASTPSLRTISLQGQRALESLPSFSGLGRLRTLYIGNSDVLTRLPSFDATPRLSTLALIHNPLLNSLPDLAPVQHSLQHVFVRSCPLCCSGYLSHGVCNYTETDCRLYTPEYGEHSCYPDEFNIEADPSLVIGSDRFPLASDASHALLQPFLDSRAVCDPNIPIQALPERAPLNTCRGVWYRQCPEGICYALSVIDMVTCVEDPAVIAMRIALIAAGDECDPVEEAWLGCT